VAVGDLYVAGGKLPLVSSVTAGKLWPWASYVAVGKLCGSCKLCGRGQAVWRVSLAGCISLASCVARAAAYVGPSVRICHRSQ
jgi:hypothetical protein